LFFTLVCLTRSTVNTSLWVSGQHFLEQAVGLSHSVQCIRRSKEVGERGVFDVKRSYRYKASCSYRLLLMNNVSRETCDILYHVPALPFSV
jgi:hypothetical protein